MSLDEAIELFLDSRKRGTAGARRRAEPRTIECYKRNLEIFKNWLESEAGVVRYDDVEKRHVRRFVDWSDAKVEGKEWSKATSLQLYRTLRTFFNWVDLDEDCKDEALEGFQKQLPRIAKTPRRVDIPQVVDLKKFKNGFKTGTLTGYRDYVATCLMLSCGIRVGELCSLTIENTKLDDRLLIVTGKTGTRIVPIPGEMVRLLKGWLKRRQGMATARKSPYVFISKKRPQMNRNSFGLQFRRHRARLGLPRISAHTFRHTFATRYLANGGDMEKLRNITGHATYDMLKEYLHLAKLSGKEIHDELDRVNPLRGI